MKYTPGQLLRRLDLNLLLTFDALMSTRSATASARLLHKTQPGVSRELARLRRVLGDALFVVVKGRFEPTERALELHGVVRSVLDQLERAVAGPQAFEPRLAQGVVNIGVGAHFELLLAPALLEIVAREAPDLVLRFHSVHGDFDPADLDAERQDVAIGIFEQVPPRFAAVTLFDDERRAVMGPGHPLAHRRRLTLADITQGRWFAFSLMHRHRTIFDRVLKGQRQRVTFSAYLSGFGISPYVLLGNRYATTMPAFAARLHARDFGLVSLPLPQPLRTMRFRMVWPRRLDGQPEQCWIREQIQAVVAQCMAQGEVQAPGALR